MQAHVRQLRNGSTVAQNQLASAARKITLRVLAWPSLLMALSTFALASTADAQYRQTNLVSDIPGLAAATDVNLQNPWGIAASATSPLWIANNRTGVATLYNGAGVATPLVVTVAPTFGGAGPAAPTGQVFNGTASFELTPGNPARFIFATEDGTISGWNPAVSPTTAILQVDKSPSGDIYKGLAIGNNGERDLLYAANFHHGDVDVFDNTFASIALAGSFTDPNLPAGYAPFNVQTMGGQLFVTYALQDAGGEDDVPGPGHGFVDVFDLNGSLVRRLISGGQLNSPWGLAVAPAGFGEFGGDLLVGNFGDGKINAFDPATGDFHGTLSNSTGDPLVNLGLWGLRFGNGGNGGAMNALFFTAGIPGPDGEVEDHGLFGKIETVPEPAELLLAAIAATTLLTFRGTKHPI
jgi:uncharacterized protein (TIGR03118 family)